MAKKQRQCGQMAKPGSALCGNHATEGGEHPHPNHRRPIVALFFVPAGFMAYFWVRHEARFQHGGDMRRCSNRDCSLTYLLVTGAASLAIALFCVVELALMLSRAKTGDDSAEANIHTSGSPKQHSTFHKLALVNNVVVCIATGLTLHATMTLRRLLGTAPRTYRNDPVGSDDDVV